MSLASVFGAAASAIAGMPEVEFAAGLAEVEDEFRRRQRDDITRARHASFVESLELDRAAYELGCRHEADGNLGEAARWYRVAAGNDHADAALRLGRTLDRLAGRCAGPHGRAELHLITEAARAYAEAYAAGFPEAADRIDEMLAGFTSGREPPPPPPAPERMGKDRCAHVRVAVPANGVLSDAQIQDLSHHAAQCITCLAEFVALLRTASAALPPGTFRDG